ncbi:MAG: hypothetical protein ACM31C_24610 [Acidobacteriota bacterium]
MRRVTVAALVPLAACGRLGFGSQPGAGDAPPAGDAVSGDGSGDAPHADAAPACLASYELCDGFEAGAFDTATWTVDPGVTIDTTFAHRGGASAHFQSTVLAKNQGGYFTLGETRTLALGDPRFYVRAWIRLGALPAGTNHMELVTAAQTGGTVYGDSLFVEPTGLSIYTQFSNTSYVESTAPPIGSWFCALWTLQRATTATGSITLAGDPAPIAIASVITDGSPPLSLLTFGIGFSGTNVATAQPVIDVWLDDVIVDGSPLTCAD